MDAARKLIEARNTRSREEVASAVGISVSALAMYELGKRVPRDETKIKLARFYGTTVEFLFFDEECHAS